MLVWRLYGVPPADVVDTDERNVLMYELQRQLYGGGFDEEYDDDDEGEDVGSPVA